MTFVELFATYVPNKHIFVFGFGFLAIGFITWLIATHWGNIGGWEKIGDDSGEGDEGSVFDVFSDDAEYEAQKQKTKMAEEALLEADRILAQEKSLLADIEEITRIKKETQKQEELYEQEEVLYRKEEESRQKEYERKKESEPQNTAGFDWHPGQNTAKKANQALKAGHKKDLGNKIDMILSSSEKEIRVDEETKEKVEEKHSGERQKLAVLLNVLVQLINEEFNNGEIARALSMQSGSSIPNEELIHTIEAVRCFINACDTGTDKIDRKPQRSKFGPDAVIGGSKVKHKSDMPGIDTREILIDQNRKAKEKALESLLAGNLEKAVDILDKEVKRQEKKGKSMKSGPLRKAAYSEASELACHAGTLAVVTDPQKALKSLELAMFLSPESADVHSRYGDLCFNLDMEEEAEQTYRKVYELADNNKEKRLIANASSKLAQIMLSRGEEQKAEKRKRESSRLFEEIGYTQELNEKEIQATMFLKNALQMQLESD